MSRFMKVLFLAIAALTLSVGCAWAENLEESFNWSAPRVTVQHVTRVPMIDGKTKYEVTEDDITAGAEVPGDYREAKFYYLNFHLNNIVAGQADSSAGEFSIDNIGPSYVNYYSVTDGFTLGSSELIHANSDTTKFPVWQFPDASTYYVGSITEGYRAEFFNEDGANSETAFSGKAFAFKFANDAAPTTGTLGTIRTTATQMDETRDCAPYLWLNMAGSKLMGINWQFAKPSDVKANPDEIPAAQSLEQAGVLAGTKPVIWIYTLSDQGISKEYRLGGNDTGLTGSTLAGYADLSSEGLELKDVHAVEFDFGYADRLTENCLAEYHWRFYPAWRKNDETMLYLQHNTDATMVDGKAADYKKHVPQFRSIFVEADVTGIAYQNVTGELTIGSRTFTLEPYEEDSYYAHQVVSPYLSTLSAETELLSGKPFSYRIGVLKVEGMAPTLHPLQQQLREIVPYFEFTKSDGKVTGVTWRFVNPSEPGVALKKEGDEGTNSVHDMRRIRLVTREGIWIDTAENTVYNTVGAPLEGTATLAEENQVRESEISEVRIYFNMGNRNIKSNSYSQYRWDFKLPAPTPSDDPDDDPKDPLTPSDPDPDPAPTPDDPTQPNPPAPTAEEVAAARAAADNDLANPPTEVIAAEQTHIKTGTFVYFGDEEVRSHTSSVIEIEQPVSAGGAVVLAAAGKMTLPLNSKTLTGVDLPKPANFADLTSKYRVNKYFETGGAVDLLERFGEKIFAYSADTGVTCTAAIVIIDGAAPEGNDVIKPYSLAAAGVKLSADNKHLYIWDGVRDNVATDPIALVSVGESEVPAPGGDDTPPAVPGSGSSGGCNAGFMGVLAIFALAVSLASRKK